jgi:hypothetical protein
MVLDTGQQIKFNRLSVLVAAGKTVGTPKSDATPIRYPDNDRESGPDRESEKWIHLFHKGVKQNLNIGASKQRWEAMMSWR